MNKIPWLDIFITVFSSTLFISLAAILMFRRGWIILPSENDDRFKRGEEEEPFNMTRFLITIIGTTVIALALYIWILLSFVD